MNSRLKELEEILTGLMGDLTIAVSVLREYEEKPYMHKPELSVSRQCIWRLCVNSIVMNCCKYEELNRKYGREFNEVIPELKPLRGKYNEAIKNNKSIGILRNDYIAHVSSQKSKKCLTPHEIQSHILSVFDGDFAGEFLDWVCPENIKDTVLERSLVGAIQLLRDAVSAKL